MCVFVCMCVCLSVCVCACIYECVCVCAWMVHYLSLLPIQN
ncbi:MAG TPA: hypothetical protein V6C97_21910 [Oculatellaceae cyanobacterium]